MTKKSLIVLSLSALLLGGAAALWQVRAHRAISERSRERERVASGIVATPVDSHRPQSSLAADGSERALPAHPALADALSATSRLDFALRLKAVHAVGRELASRPLTEAQAAALRAFIADPVIPEGLNIQQVRALKNDVLNVLCLCPGGEAATAATLRTLYADESQDAGLRDYALQHLVTLIDRNPAIGWDTHWTAVESDSPALAATAMLHLAARLRAQSSSANLQPFSPSALQSLSSAALRLAADPAARDWSISSRGELFDAASTEVSAAKAALAVRGAPVRVSAVLWMQGEKDATDRAKGDAYETNLRAFIARVRARWGDAQTVFEIGRIDDLGDGYPGASAVRRAQARVAETSEHVTLTDTDAFPRQPSDGLHLTAKAQVALGDGFFEAGRKVAP